uniref:Uncharacterized protein n=1 Tax=Rhizophora mucronata TaxID=61149 RepID=A0A2P2JJ68_RHIMU
MKASPWWKPRPDAQSWTSSSIETLMISRS